MFDAMCRAVMYLEKVNLAVIRHAMRRRAAQDRGEGARPVPSLAAGPVGLEVLTEPRPGGKAAPITPLGYKTAVRRLPPVLAALGRDDPRRRAAVAFGDAWERLGASGGSSLDGGDPSASGLVPDGGATTRVKYAERLRDAYAVTRARVPGQVRKMITARPVPRVVLAPQRKGRGGQEIKAITLLVGVCVEGKDMLEILGAHGWGRKASHRQTLAAALLEMLDDLADAWGLGRAAATGSAARCLTPKATAA
jgi:hypothetical protein